MATTITAGNATNGAAISSDGTGTLDIKTGTGAGTTALSIDASQNVTIPGTLTIAGQPAGGNYAMNAYVAPATWTKPTGLKAVKVTVVGAGGTGGAQFVQPTGPGNNAGGGGGGAGGTAIEYIPAPSIPGPVAVTAGPGTNSFGAFCSATAGSTGGAGSNPANSGAGGGGGSGSGGTVNITGGRGQPGSAGSGFSNGNGGTSPTGSAGAGYGGGGNASGGAGTAGIVIIEEFY
jgi:hypothetical protein